ncbi:MAG TPA: ATP-binding protein [Microlunatus sp.]
MVRLAAPRRRDAVLGWVAGADARLARLRWPLLAALAAGVVVAGTAGRVLGLDGATAGPVWMTVTFAATFTPLAVFVLRRLPTHPIGHLMLWIGLSSILATLAVCWSTLLPLAWLSQWTWWPPIALIPILLLRFPDGRLLSPRWRPLAGVLVVAAVVATAALAAAALTAPRTLVTTGTPVPPAGKALVRAALAAVLILGTATVAVLAALVDRARAASPIERRQLACLLPSAALFLVGFALDYLNVPGGWLATVIALPLGLSFAILQYRLYDLDLYIHRGVVWLLLTILAVAAYAGAVTLVETLIAQRSPATSTLIAGGVVAACLVPAERWAQRATSSLLYGGREDPYTLITRAGSHVAAVADPLAVLPRLAATVVDDLRIPYASIVLTAGLEDPLIVEHGRRSGEPERFTMRAHGTEIGELLVGQRRPGAQFSGAERRLLRGLAGQAALAGEACRSTLDLQRAREQLVLAREEERRRLRRELHDGVSSGLVGARLLTSAAQHCGPGDARMPALLDELARDLESCTLEIRSLIDGLRPAALDNGLAAALSTTVARANGSTLTTTLFFDNAVGDLPAAVEVVAYRIVTEAVVNVTKHAAAQHCTVRVDRDGHLVRVSIDDDGRGLAASTALPAAPPSTGVGIASIRTRLDEVGGTLEIVSSTAGTSVRASIPVHQAPHLARNTRAEHQTGGQEVHGADPCRPRCSWSSCPSPPSTASCSSRVSTSSSSAAATLSPPDCRLSP